MTTQTEMPQQLQEQVAATQIPINLILQFLSKYREFEKATYDEGKHIINSAFPRSMTASYLVDRWRYNKKNFGGFFLNLDSVNQITLLHYWGIKGDDDAKFLEEYKKNQMVALFTSPRLRTLMHNVVLFFNNQGITKKIWFRESEPVDFQFSVFPKEAKCFGNSANWADFVLSLPRPEQVALLSKIASHYKG